MAFKEVFQSLQEIFPQVDLRILKAVAIEHPEDVDAAVEFTLYEVLPLISGQSEAPYNLHGTLDTKDSPPSEGSESVVRAIVSEDDHSSARNVKSSGTRAGGEDPLFGLVTEQNTHNFSWHDHEVAEEVSILPGMGHEMPYMSDCANSASHLKSSCFDGTTSGDIPSDAFLGDDSVQLFAHGEPEEVSLEKDTTLSHYMLSSDCHGAVVDINIQRMLNLEAISIVSDVHKNAHNFPSSTLGKSLDSFELEVGDASCLSESEDKHPRCSVKSADIQDLGALEAPNVSCAAFTSAQGSSLVIKETINPMRCRAINKDVSSSASEYEEQQSKLVSENGAELFSFETDMVSVEADNLPTKVDMLSSQVVSIDVLEELIVDAKNNKKVLASAMESVIHLMKEVDLNEERAKKAKNAAVAAGQDALAEVEEHRQMLKHAKEANEMHAGEVYGEKSVLATEARELQSRLLSLSNDKDRSLSIIEEIHQTLEERLAAAQEELEATEKEMIEKEELSHKTLKEQELIMESIVQESKKLQAAAEENLKLREFLADRGRIVDALKGEIAVICEDVISLKHRVDNHVPLNRSVTSHSSLASSVSSSLDKGISSDQIFHHVELAESPGKNTKEDLTAQQLSSSANKEKEFHQNTPKVPADDDWEIFDDTNGKLSW